jgi:hypothetical protein
MPATMGTALVSRVETPAVARTVPRWKASCKEMKARPLQASSRPVNTGTGRVPSTADLVATSPAA